MQEHYLFRLANPILFFIFSKPHKITVLCDFWYSFQLMIHYVLIFANLLMNPLPISYEYFLEIVGCFYAFFNFINNLHSDFFFSIKFYCMSSSTRIIFVYHIEQQFFLFHNIFPFNFHSHCIYYPYLLDNTNIHLSLHFHIDTLMMNSFL